MGIPTINSRLRTEYYFVGLAIRPDGNGVAVAERYGITPEMFSSAAAGLAYAAAARIYKAGKPPDAETVLEWLGNAILANGTPNDIVLGDMAECYTTDATLSGNAEFLRKCHYKDQERTWGLELAAANESGDEAKADEAREVLQRIARERAGAGHDLRLVRHGDFTATPHEPPPFVVEGLFDKGEVVMLASDSKAGKSWFLLQMATCIGAGREFLGMATNKGGVVYLNLEISEGAWWIRCRQQAEAWGLDPDHPDKDVLLFHACARGMKLTTENVIPLIRRAMDDCGLGNVSLIIIDPYYTLASELDENAAGEVANVMLAFQRLAEELDCAVLIAHHYAKGNANGKKVLDRSSGSGVFGRSVDASLNLTKVREDEEDKEYRFEVVRRNAKCQAPSVVRFDWPLWNRVEGESSQESVRYGRPKKWVVEEIVKRIGDGETVTRAELLRRGISRSSVDSLIEEGLRRFLIVRTSEGIRLYDAELDS